MVVNSTRRGRVRAWQDAVLLSNPGRDSSLAWALSPGGLQPRPSWILGPSVTLCPRNYPSNPHVSHSASCASEKHGTHTVLHLHRKSRQRLEMCPARAFQVTKPPDCALRTGRFRVTWDSLEMPNPWPYSRPAEWESLGVGAPQCAPPHALHVIQMKSELCCSGPHPFLTV